METSIGSFIIMIQKEKKFHLNSEIHTPDYFINIDYTLHLHCSGKCITIMFYGEDTR